MAFGYRAEHRPSLLASVRDLEHTLDCETAAYFACPILHDVTPMPAGSDHQAEARLGFIPIDRAIRPHHLGLRDEILGQLAFHEMKAPIVLTRPLTDRRPRDKCAGKHPVSRIGNVPLETLRNKQKEEMALWCGFLRSGGA